MIRDLIHSRITPLIAAFDAHNPGVLDGNYQCPSPCRWEGTEAEWETHLADALADVLAAEEVGVAG